MSAMLTPIRFHLSEEQVIAALSLADVHPTKRSMLPDTPCRVEPLSLLKGTGILSSNNKRMTTEAETALRIAADPSHMLSVIANNVDQDHWVETSILHGQKDDAYIMLASNNNIYDFAFVPTSAQAAVLIDEMLGLTSMISHPGESKVSLDLSGYGAMLATADVIQEARLRARLDRIRQPVPAITTQLLEEQLIKGLDNTDTRWAVTAGRMVCPTHLRSATGRMQEGAEQFRAGGFLNKAGNGYTLTRSGFILISGLGQLVNTGGFSLAISDDSDRLTISHASLFRTAFSIWIVTWSDITKQYARCSLFESSAAGAIGFVRNFLDPGDIVKSTEKEKPPEESIEAATAVKTTTETVSQAAPAMSGGEEITCRFCGRKNAPGSTFCHGCGRDLASSIATTGPSDVKICRFCGRLNSPDAMFCNGCGKQIN